MSTESLGMDLPTPHEPDFVFSNSVQKHRGEKEPLKPPQTSLFPAKGLFQLLQCCGLDVLWVFLHTQCSHIPAQSKSLDAKTEWPTESPSTNKFQLWILIQIVVLLACDSRVLFAIGVTK